MKKVEGIDKIILGKRKEIENEIISFLKDNNVTRFDFYDWEGLPILELGYRDTYALSAIVIKKNKLIFEGNGQMYEEEYSVYDFDITLLFDLYNWLLENEEEIVIAIKENSADD
jgi:hypothetical protein